MEADRVLGRYQRALREAGLAILEASREEAHGGGRLFLRCRAEGLLGALRDLEAAEAVLAALDNVRKE